MGRSSTSSPIPVFDPESFLRHLGPGRTVSRYRRNALIYSQSDPADAVFYVQEGKVKLTTVSESGKEAVIGIFSKGDFFGDGCIVGQPLRSANAVALISCSLLKIT